MDPYRDAIEGQIADINRRLKDTIQHVNELLRRPKPKTYRLTIPGNIVVASTALLLLCAMGAACFGYTAWSDHPSVCGQIAVCLIAGFPTIFIGAIVLGVNWNKLWVTR